jgi:hypothetical protein
MDPEKINDLEIAVQPMTDAEIAAELYRYLTLVLDDVPPEPKPNVIHGPN